METWTTCRSVLLADISRFGAASDQKPANYHEDSGGLALADGHAEIRR
jgi:hypothetical protein